MRFLVLLSVLLAGAAPAAAQPLLTSHAAPGYPTEVPARTSPLTPQTSPVPRGQGNPDHASVLRARYHVRQMESVLQRAVQHAADMMSRRLQAMSPEVMALAGAPRAQGFRIDGYGLFFSVEVPRLSESVNWALQVLSQDRDERVLRSLQQVAVAQSDPALRTDLERAIRAMQLQMAARRLPVGAGGPVSDTAPSSVAAAAVPSSQPYDAVLDDPGRAYEEEVKSALTDAMLDYAGSLQIEGAEWVTVAARDAGYMALPDAVADMVTVTLSVRASDLAAFRAGSLTREAARARVLVREF